MSWQPIDSAPKDGTRFLAFWDDSCVWDKMEIVFWNETGQAWSGGDCETFTPRWRGEESPSHWMPLPAGPEPMR